MSICIHGFESHTSHCAKCDNTALHIDRNRLRDTLDDVRILVNDLYAMRGEDEYTATACNKVTALIDRGF